MPEESPEKSALQDIFAAMRTAQGSADRFSEQLRHAHVPHLSFTQVSTVEACQRRYFLQYIALVDPDPIPEYFTKGKLLHQVIAASYDSLRKQQALSESGEQLFAEAGYQGLTLRHLLNAAQVHRENLWLDYQVVGIEEPFVLEIQADLPPCVGIIDLVLRQGERYVVVDHKTGRDFSPQDELQMAIYVQYVQAHYGGLSCEFYYDHYRWVNNLQRIRKPAFQRTRVHLRPGYWEASRLRMQRAYETMKRIRRQGWGVRNGQCFRCPYKSVC